MHSTFRCFDAMRRVTVKPHQLTDLHIYMIHECHEGGTAVKHSLNLNF